MMPHWLNQAVFYEIYPQSFKDSNADGIGDLVGLLEKLDYIESLGCNAVWLNPCFESPFFDAGYDISDYCKVAPRYGTNEDLVRLFREVHKRNMHLLLDLVPGHTSVEHPWFKESMKPEPNALSDRYIWTDSIWKDIGSVPNITGTIRGVSQRDGCCAVNFFSTQPALNYGFANTTESWQSPVDSPAAQSTFHAMLEVMDFWLDQGCDGFRVDMAGSLVKNDPGEVETIRLWQKFRKHLDEHYPDAVLVSEWGEPDKSLLGGFHMDFLLHFGPSHYNDLFRVKEPFFSKQGKGTIQDFLDQYILNREKTKGKGLVCIPSGNHDMTRLSSGHDVADLKLIFAFLLSMPGVPFVYYGDEIGMRAVACPSVEGGYGRTASRSPMQWNQEANCGFSDADETALYIPVDSKQDRPCVEEQTSDPHSLLSEVKRLIRLRKNTPALLADGAFVPLWSRPYAYPFVYQRGTGSGRVIVALNPSDATVDCPVKLPPNHTQLYQLGDSPLVTDTGLRLSGCSAAFFQIG